MSKELENRRYIPFVRTLLESRIFKIAFWVASGRLQREEEEHSQGVTNTETKPPTDEHLRDHGKEFPSTRLLSDPAEIIGEVKKAMAGSSSLCTFANSEGLRIALDYFEDDYKGIIDRKGGGIRVLVPIDTQRDAEFVKRGLQIGLEIRHIDQEPQPSFSVLDSQLFTSMDSMVGSTIVNNVLVTNDPLYIQQYREIFRTKWEADSLDARERVREIEGGVERDRTEIVNDVGRAAKIAQDCFLNATNEILIILASQQVVTRNLSLYQEMVQYALNKGIKVRILLPSIDADTPKLFQNVEWRSIDRMNVGYAIYDRKKMFITQYATSSEDSSTGTNSIITNIFTTNREHIAGIVSIFDALWRESDLRQAAERSRREGELLQDILSHDIRNFNQAARLNAELLEDDITSGSSRAVLSSLISAIDGSSALVDRAAKIGKILAAGSSVHLSPVPLRATIERSLAIVRGSVPEKTIECTVRTNDAEVPTLLADEMLEDVFVNLFSNAAKYTQENEVRIEVCVETEGDWVKVTVSDHSRGISDEQKALIFKRYVKGAHGSGLGLSIVHALVVDRYSGKIKVDDRVKGNPSRGTSVELLLRNSL